MRNSTWIALVALVGAGPAPAAELDLVQTIVLKGKAGKLDHLALDARRDRLFLANTTNGTLDVVDLKAGKLLKQVPGQSGIQGVAYAADLDRVFVGLGSGGMCNIFDGSDYKPLKTIKLPDSDNVVYDPARSLVFVAHAEKALGVVDTKSGKEVAGVPVPDGIDDLFYDAKRKKLFASCGEGFVAVIRQLDADHYELAEKVATSKQAKTSFLDADTGRLFVGVPRQEGK